MTVYVWKFFIETIKKTQNSWLAIRNKWFTCRKTVQSTIKYRRQETKPEKIGDINHDKTESQKKKNYYCRLDLKTEKNLIFFSIHNCYLPKKKINLPILMIVLHCIPEKPFITKPKPSVAPVILCVVDTGNRAKVAIINQAEQPEQKKTFDIFLHLKLNFCLNCNWRLKCCIFCQKIIKQHYFLS